MSLEFFPTTLTIQVNGASLNVETKSVFYIWNFPIYCPIPEFLIEYISFTVSSTPNLSIINDVLCGTDPKINENDIIFLYEFACHFGWSELIKLAHTKLPDKSFIPYIPRLFAIVFDSNVDFSNLVDIAADQFNKFNEDINSLPLRVQDMILQSPLFSLHSDEKLKFIQSKVDINQSPNHYLCKSLPFEAMSSSDRHLFFANPKLNLNTIATVFLDHTLSLSKRSYLEVETMQYSPQFPSVTMSGIIHSIVKINIKSSDPYSSKYDCQNLLLNDRNRYFCTHQNNGEIIITIPNHVFKMSHYELRSWKFGSNLSCPKNWKVFIKNIENDQWILVDQRVNNTDLIGDWKTALFSIDDSEHLTNSVKFVQMDSNSRRNKRFVLGGLDIYGTAIVS